MNFKQKIKNFINPPLFEELLEELGEDFEYLSLVNGMWCASGVGDELVSIAQTPEEAIKALIEQVKRYNETTN